jgi:UDP-3-O-[3-hydroxymyristoyl] glucosamine N-acyltransferase
MRTAHINQILKTLPVKATNISGDLEVNGIIQLPEQNEDGSKLFWCNDKNIGALAGIHKGIVIASDKIQEVKLHLTLNYIIVDKPRQAFSKVVKEFFAPRKREARICASAVVSKQATLGKGVFIGENVVIEEGCTIGDSCTILHNTVILAGTVIGSNVFIGCNNTIGGVGFGYEKSEDGNYELLPHIGNVIISDRVEIGNNTCIDRAVLGSTFIGENAKIDNQVHVAHGVQIGSNSLVIAHAMLGGSCIIGENSWISPGALIINKGQVGNNSLVGMGAVVIKPVEENSIVAGNPSKLLRKADPK